VCVRERGREGERVAHLHHKRINLKNEKEEWKLASLSASLSEW